MGDSNLDGYHDLIVSFEIRTIDSKTIRKSNSIELWKNVQYDSSQSLTLISSFYTDDNSQIRTFTPETNIGINSHGQLGLNNNNTSVNVLHTMRGRNEVEEDISGKKDDKLKKLLMMGERSNEDVKKINDHWVEEEKVSLLME